MRQTKSLPLTSVVPISEGLCRLSSVPAERWSFPALSPQSLRRCLDPYPAVFSWCTCSFLPRRQRPHVRRQTLGTPHCPCNATSTGNAISGLQSFSNVQAPTLARPPGCTHRWSTESPGQPGRLHHAMDMGLPPRTVASLRVRIEQLTRRDSHPLDCGLAGRYRRDRNAARSTLGEGLAVSAFPLSVPV